MAPALVTLIMGVILGYLAQRSRICFIGGLRDFILVRDKELLKGVAAFFVTAWLAFSVAGYFGLLDLQAPEYQGSSAAGQGMVSHSAADTVASVVQVSTLSPTNDIAAEKPAVRSAAGLFQLGWPILVLTVSAGLVIGLFSTLANGCPTRQHVLASQGMKDSMFYLAGFYLGVIVYYLVTKPLLAFII